MNDLREWEKSCGLILINEKMKDIIGAVRLEIPLLIHHQSLTISPAPFTGAHRPREMSAVDGHFKGEQISSIYQKIYPTPPPQYSLSSTCHFL